MKIDLEPYELDRIISALALYAKQGDDMGDLEIEEVNALGEKLNDLAENLISSQEEPRDGRFEDSSSYRSAMIDAGRGRLIR